MRLTTLPMLALLLALALPLRSWAAEDAFVSSPASLLERAFDARYDCTLSGIVDIETRKGRTRAVGRSVRVASKLIDDRLHTYARFHDPPYLRGMAFLGIEPEQPGQNEQRFVYLPSLRRVRRVGGSHSSDSFLGTDLSYHDFERQHADEFEVSHAAPSASAPEPVWILEARPRRTGKFVRTHYQVAHSDFAILATHYFKRGHAEPYKIMKMPRSGIRTRGHCRIPGRVDVEDRQRRTSTALRVRALEIDASFEDSLFTMTALQTSRDIPGLRTLPTP